MTTLVGVYTRISDDRAGDAAGVERQLSDCLSITKRRGWTVHAEYRDNDFSAYKRNVKRPEFDRMLADLDSGVISGVVVWDLDRFTRQPIELERLIAMFDRHEKRTLVFASAQGDYNLATSDGRAMARVMVTMANKSSADTARRVSRKRLEVAQSGRSWGGQRPFGWKSLDGGLVAKEAKLIRDAVGGLLAGTATLGGTAAEWNALGITSVRGNRWNTTTVRAVLSNPRLVGYRVHRGEICRDAKGDPVRGKWTPILDEATWDALSAYFSDPRRKRQTSASRRHLLTGFIVCGRCGRRMVGEHRPAVKISRYVCPSGSGGCGNTVQHPSLERMVVEGAMRAYGAMSSAHTEAKWEKQPELDEAENGLRETQEAILTGALSRSDGFPLIRAYRERIDSLKAERSAWVAAQAGITQRPVDARKAWEVAERDAGGGLAKKQRLLRGVLREVVVHPANGHRRWNPDRVELVWQQRLLLPTSPDGPRRSRRAKRPSA